LAATGADVCPAVTGAGAGAAASITAGVAACALTSAGTRARTGALTGAGFGGGCSTRHLPQPRFVQIPNRDFLYREFLLHFSSPLAICGAPDMRLVSPGPRGRRRAVPRLVERPRTAGTAALRTVLPIGDRQATLQRFGKSTYQTPPNRPSKRRIRTGASDQRQAALPARAG